MQPYAKWQSEREAYAKSKLERKYRRICGGFTLVANYDPMQTLVIGKTICELCVYEHTECRGSLRNKTVPEES